MRWKFYINLDIVKGNLPSTGKIAC